MIQSINPFNNEVLATFNALTEQETAGALAKGDTAFSAWKEFSFTQRAEIMLKVASLLKEQQETLAGLATLEMGKPVREARAEVLKCATVCSYYAEYAEKHLQAEHLPTENQESYVVYEPLGVVLGIMPWNFPYWQVFRFAIPALMAGNAALLKHSSNVPQCALAIEKLFLAAALPEGVFQTLLISAAQATALVEDPVIKAISLTGSTDAGAKVAEMAGKYIKKAVLELGGSDAFIVLADADVQKAASTAVKARLQNNGQSCIAAKRFIIEEAVVADFLHIAKEEMMKLKVGDPLLETTDIGPLAKMEFAQLLHQQLNIGLVEGATIIYGDAVDGAFFPPTLVKIDSPNNSLFLEETFGPLMVVLAVVDEEEAVRVANNSVYGLGASLWTKDPERAKQIVPKIQAGSVFINTMVKSDAHLPFGGIKQSGYGRELSQYGIREFVNIKTVVINS